ncbi:MAG: hypothetical protein SFW66_09215 [Gammaproteobacteria bacterium]|nr:hypothetical protein [Gammaproteobacteria bacterium]
MLNRPEATEPLLNDTIAIHVDDEKESFADYDLDSTVKRRLMNWDLHVSEKTRLDIMNCLALEMSTFVEYDPKDLVDALRMLMITDPALRRMIQPQSARRNLFSVDTFGDEIMMIWQRMPDVFCSPAFCFISCVNPDLGYHFFLAICSCAAALSFLYCIVKQPIEACNHPSESSASKVLKLLTPITLSASTAFLLYRYCNDTFSEWGDYITHSNLAGEIGFNALFSLTAYIIASMLMNRTHPDQICGREQKLQRAIQDYIDTHPVNEAVMTAIRESNIKRLLTEWHGADDSVDDVITFSNELLNCWIERIDEIRQQYHKPLVKQQPAIRTLSP